MACEEKLYAIREVSEITGVKPVTLRAWQRRYNLVQPQRTAKGHRLYTDHDIQTIRQIQSWLLKGVSIGKVSQLLQGNAAEVGNEPELRAELEECEALLSALAQLNRGKAENVIGTVMKEYPLDIVERQFVLPVIDALEKVKGPLRSLQKGLLNGIMLSKLSTILESENKAAHKGKCLAVSFDPSGSLLAWLWAVTWAEQGYNVTLLDGVEDMTGLAEHESLAAYNAVALFSHRGLAENQWQAKQRLAAQFGDQLFLSDVLQTLAND
ncbi:MerR family transcriptional regulator [Vibrio fluvialis]|nr:MerR family transcriptional regulator [Vibrio fluvialis]